MGCKANKPRSEIPQEEFFAIESKRFQTLNYNEKPDNRIEFTLKIVPYNSEIERVSSITLEIAKYTLEKRPPFVYTLIDLFYNNPEELDLEDRLCFKIKEDSTNQRMILRMIPFQDYNDYAFKSALYEIYLLQSFSGMPGLIKLRDFFINDFGKNRKKFILFFFEEAEFTLNDLLVYRKGTKNNWKEEELLRIMREFAEIGLALEKTNICHRDIRPENFWYSFKDGKWKLANFSCARLYQIQGNDTFSHERLLNTFRGKPEIQAPEVRAAFNDSTERKIEPFNAYMNDIYALGHLFLKLNQTEIKLDSQLIEKAEIMEAWDDILSIEVICKMMNGNSHRRPFYGNIKELLKTEDKASQLKDRKLEFSLYSELKSQIDNESSIQLRILKQEKFAHAYFKLLQTEHALSQFDELLTFFDQHYDEENRAHTLKEIGEFSHLLGNSAKAVELFKDSLAVYNRLGNEARKTGNYHKAVSLFEKALGISGMLYSSKDMNFINVLENCGNAYRLADMFNEAKKCQEKALGILIQLKGEKSIEVVRLLNNLANTHAGLKRYDMSIELLKNAIKILRGEEMKEHVNLLAMALCNIGEMYRHKKMLPEAKTAIEEALIIKEKIYGIEPNLEVASALDNLGNVYYDLNEFLKAKKLYEKALIMKEGCLGDFNIEIALSLNNLGNTTRCLKEFKTAEGFYKKALQIYKSNIREKNPAYAMTCGNIGLVYKDLGKKEEARRHLHEAAKILKENYTENDNDYNFFKKELDNLR